MKHLLVFDLSNMCYIGSGAVQGEKSVEQYFHASLKFLRSQYRYFKPEHVVFACDHESAYWRSAIYSDYKGHRVDNEFKQKVREVIKRFKAENSHLCIEHPSCEADDIIYALCQYTDFRITIVSSDGDFEQLISDRVRVFNPGQFGFRIRPRDVAFSLFVKCIRGDRGDNIPSVLPMITLKRLQQAYAHKEPMAFLQQHYRFNSELEIDYQRNRTLIDFNCIPEDLKVALQDKVVRHFELL